MSLNRRSINMWLLAGAVVMVLAFIAGGCGDGTTTTTAAGTPSTAAPAGETATTAGATDTTSGALQGEVKIGSTLPLSGFAANYGKEAQLGIEMAVDKANAEGGINGKKLVALVEDSGGDAKTAVSATQKLINVDKVAAMVATMFSSEAQAEAPLVDASKVPLILGMANAPGLNTLSEYMFEQSPSANADAMAIAKYATERRGTKTAAVLAGEGAYAVAMADLLSGEFEKAGGKVVVNEVIPSSTTDFRTVLGKAKGAGAEVIILLDLGQTPVVIRQMSELGFEADIAGSSMLRDASIVEAVGDLFEGAYYPIPGPVGDEAKKAEEDFLAAYSAKYGGPPKTVTPYLAYDAVNLIISAMREGGESSDQMLSWLNSVQDFPGTLGELTFKDNQAIKPDFIEEVRDGQFVRTDFYVIEGQ